MDDPRKTRQHVPAFHGYAPGEASIDVFVPPLSIVISREAGSQGRAIARKTAEMLGWDLVAQDVLEYGAANPGFSTGFGEDLASPAAAWVEEQLADIVDRGLLPSSERELFLRSVLEIAAVGGHVLLGDAANLILPKECKLAVRLTAPERDRIAYISEVERLSASDAKRFVRDAENAGQNEADAFQGLVDRDVNPFDVVLNTVQFGIEGCAAIIVAAANERREHLADK